MIRLQNISKIYRNKTVPALDQVSLTINDGEMVSVVGKSGSGKSTLLNIIGMLDIQTRGSYFYNGIEVNDHQRQELRKRIGIVLQNYALIPEKTVYDNIALPLYYLRSHKPEIKRKVQEVSEALGISGLLRSYPNQLSGGECQRAAIARALITQPEILLADEPTGSMDTENRDIILDIIRSLNQRGISILIVTHDAAVANCCKRKLTLQDGRIQSDSIEYPIQ